MGSKYSKTLSQEEVLAQKMRDEFEDIFSSLHQDCQINALSCHYSAGRHEFFARFLELSASSFGVMSAGGFGVMHFYKAGLSLKGKGILGGTSSILAACFALSTLFSGIKSSSRSPAILSEVYNQSTAEWDELGQLLEVYQRVKVKDPKVNLSELELMCKEVLRRKKEVALRTRVEDWACKKAMRDLGLFKVKPIEPEVILNLGNKDKNNEKDVADVEKDEK